MRTIQRYYIDERGVAKSDTGEWMRADEVNAVFKLGVAYMPVPRCEDCAHWDRQIIAGRPLSGGMCRRAGLANSGVIIDEQMETHKGFGCVSFKEKA